jgi:hypothetical protein
VAHYGCGKQKTHIFNKQIGVNMKQSAFPISGSQYRHTEGMTLRDYFAAKAMQGLVENANWRGMPEDALAKESYKLANEMLKARGE